MLTKKASLRQKKVAGHNLLPPPLGGGDKNSGCKDQGISWQILTKYTGFLKLVLRDKKRLQSVTKSVTNKI